MEKASISNHYLYNPELKERAKDLRSTMTKSEVVLWKHALHRSKMLGFTFNRQRPVMNYIVDFMCKALLLVIEVDGITHRFSDVSVKDAHRQADLEEAGFTVIRFSSSDVMNRTKDVVSIIQRQCEVLISVKG